MCRSPRRSSTWLAWTPKEWQQVALRAKHDVAYAGMLVLIVVAFYLFYLPFESNT